MKKVIKILKRKKSIPLDKWLLYEKKSSRKER